MLEVRVRVVFLGEADAAVDLDVLGGHVEVNVGGAGPDRRLHYRDLVGVRASHGCEFGAASMSVTPRSAACSFRLRWAGVSSMGSSAPGARRAG
jgi:hypothetical protein